MFRSLVTFVLLFICQSANAWQWVVVQAPAKPDAYQNWLKQPGVTTGGQVKEPAIVQEFLTAQDCPNGQCNRQPVRSAVKAVLPPYGQPTLAAPDCTCANCQCGKSVAMQSVMVRQYAGPVRRVTGRLFSGRLFGRLRCR